ncbi:hypothetical protein RHGRI_000690 [Rhododendron griersonianum]|uniref:Uncharacterized protein n=1 Tax=Rhododendron griersonianum TaxID=479676 RepID=A0AAV6LIL2_9ERIC|nr:hypothetical protein RHGRI_000690 [Rhododendron griersonianum]
MKVGPEGETSPSREFIAMLFKMTRVTDYAAKKYEYLKVVELVGCVGSIVVEFIACVLEHAVSLEKVVVNPRITCCEWLPQEYELRGGADVRISEKAC